MPPSTRLFTPLKIRGVELRNRIAVSPMCQYSAVQGVAQPWHMVHLGARAVGGAGLVITEASGVSPEGRISPECLGIWNETQAEALKPIVDFIRSQGAVAGIQLAHAGRKASTFSPWKGRGTVPLSQGGWKPLAPSALAFDESSPVPTALDSKGIAQIKQQFVSSAKLALQAGFQVIELHMAHGYLLHEFLSPLSNQRSDAYGGSLENRMRFPIEVAHAVREVMPPNAPLFARISATDWVEGGWDLEQSVALSTALKESGVDLIDCSSGGTTPTAKIPAGPNFQVPFASRIKKDSGLLSGAVGFITEPEQAEKILQESHADLVLLAREFLRDPQWPLHAAYKLGAEIQWPNPYARAH